MSIHPWHILAGLGTVEREELCSYIAMFQDASLVKLAADRIADINPFKDAESDSRTAYRRRLDATTAELVARQLDDDTLRLMLWAELRAALNCPADVPLSFRTGMSAGADIAHRASELLAGEVKGSDDLPEDAGWLDRSKRLLGKAKSALGLGDVPEFGAVVAAQAARLVAEASKEGALDEARKQEIVEAFRRRLAEQPPELRDATATRAVEMGDTAILSLLAGGGALVGAGVAVEMAGFGAYVLAAQASAFIPLLGGKAAVSALFVLANPLFAVPAIIGGGWYAKHGVEKGVRGRLAAGLAVLLALRGLSSGHASLQMCLDSFRRVEWQPLEGAVREHMDQVEDVARAMGGKLPASAGTPPGYLAKPVEGAPRSEMDRLLFPDHSATGAEIAAVGALTLGDILYSAVSIDPKVVAAADFSRSEDLADLFRFGAFSERISELSGKALMGAENNLRGYVAEQIVAVRMAEKGSQVSLPDTSNNPGYDLLVDGAEVQVKCLTNIGGLAEHFAKYPDTPVVANSDLADAVMSSGAPWADKVIFVDGYDYEAADSLLHEALEAGEDLMGLDVPYFAVAVSAAKHLHGWWRGAVPLSDVPFEVAVDGAVRGSLAVAGGLSGQALGLLLFGPAGAVVFGGVGGVAALFGAGSARAMLDKLLSGEWVDRLDAASLDLAQALMRVVRRRSEMLDGKLALLADQSRQDIVWVRNRMLDDKVFLAEAGARIAALDALSPQDRARAALRLTHQFAIHPWSVQQELDGLVRVLDEQPTVVGGAKSAIGSLIAAAKAKRGPQVES